MKLPSLYLPKFSGSREACFGFCDTFRSTVHENPNVKDAKKLIHVRSCLVRKVTEKIELLKTTTANYSVAWNILEKRYDDLTQESKALSNAYKIQRYLLCNHV